MNQSACISNMITYMEGGVSPFHVVNNTKEMLINNGFQELFVDKEWNLKPNENYFICPYASTMIAFHLGEGPLRLATAHTDSPSFKVKPGPSIQKSGGMVVNVEKYGGMIYTAWLDRPLGVAGKVMLKGTSVYEPETVFFDSKRAIAIIPGLAIHMQRNANEKNEIKMQANMLPLIGVASEKQEKEDEFLSYLASEIKCKPEDILDYDLYFYVNEKAQFIGEKEDLLAAPRIDNLSSCYALTDALIRQKESKNLCVAAFFDNEEIGSRTKQGADSNLLEWILQKIYRTLDRNLMSEIRNGFLLSFDVAHACHPNYNEKSDPIIRTKMGSGVAVKTSAAQKYASDSRATACILQLGEKYGVRIQRQVNHSDIPGGSTLGPITTGYLPIYGVDAGVAILSMHSAIETASVFDCEQLVCLANAYFSEN